MRLSKQTLEHEELDSVDLSSVVLRFGCGLVWQPRYSVEASLVDEVFWMRELLISKPYWR